MMSNDVAPVFKGLSKHNQNERIKVSFPELEGLHRQIEEIKVTFDNIDLDANDICHCRVYFNYNNMQLNNMLFFDGNIEADCKEIVIGLQQPKNGSALAYYNRHILDYHSSFHPSDTKLQPIIIELSTNIQSDALVKIFVNIVSYSVFNIELIRHSIHLGDHTSDNTNDDKMQNLRPPQSIQTFSVSLFKLMTANSTLSELAGIHMVSRIKGDVRATFRQVDTNGSGAIEKDELRAVLQKLGGVVNDEEIDKCFDEVDANKDGMIDFDEFSQWYLRCENLMQADVNELFSRFDHDNNGYIGIEELEHIVSALKGPGEPQPTVDEVEAARKILDSNDDGRISRQDFLQNWIHQF